MASAAWSVPFEERRVREEDYAALYDLHVDTMKRYVAATYGWIDDVQASMFREDWPTKTGQRVLVERATQRLVACWLVERRADEHFVRFVEVASSHQRRGLGTAILVRVLDDAALAGHPVKLAVMKANPDAKRLYERLGFLVDRETETHHWMTASHLGR